jgi:hypothetical protein
VNYVVLLLLFVAVVVVVVEAAAVVVVVVTLCREFTITYPKQTIFLGYVMLQSFCG